MTRLTTLALLLAALAATGCGNDTMLSGLSGALGGDGNGSGDGDGDDGCSGDEAAMAAAAADLAANLCADCNPGSGTAEELFAEINPQDYTGGPLEVGLVIGNPAGIAGSETLFKINGVAFEIPDAAWKLSDDGTVGRVVLLREAGLPQGQYVVKLAIFAAAPAPAFNEEEEPATGADASATWSVECPDDEPGDDEPGDDEPGDDEPGDDEPVDEPSEE